MQILANLLSVYLENSISEQIIDCFTKQPTTYESPTGNFKLSISHNGFVSYSQILLLLNSLFCWNEPASTQPHAENLGIIIDFSLYPSWASTSPSPPTLHPICLQILRIYLQNSSRIFPYFHPYCHPLSPVLWQELANTFPAQSTSPPVSLPTNRSQFKNLIFLYFFRR